MNEISEALWMDYEAKRSMLEGLTPGTDEYKMVSAELDSIRKELIENSKNESEKDIRISQMKEEARREKIRNVITIVTFGVTTAVSIGFGIQTFRFDTEHTTTSTLGRQILNGFIPKFRK